ncbi:hypothetical protein [Streptomyces sp. NPDC055692]
MVFTYLAEELRCGDVAVLGSEEYAVSLAEAYPRVTVWWCPAGHERQENISNRTALPKWK